MSTDYNLIYLASPYSHSNLEVRESRFKAAQTAAVKLLHKGLFVFSPIAYNHPMLDDHELPTSWEFWKPYDLAFLERCSELIVLMLDGWDISTGVAAEIAYALEHNIPIKYITMEEL